MSRELQHWDVEFSNAESWATVMADGYGMSCTLHRSHLPGCTIKARLLGEIQLTSARVAWQTISPLKRLKRIGDADDYLYYKIVQSGAFDLVVEKKEQHFGSGSVLFIDPDSHFFETYREPTELLLLRLPKKALRERGGYDNAKRYLAPDICCPDVRTVREFVQFMERHTCAVSPYLSEQLSRQCLDFMDLLLTRPDADPKAPSAKTAFHVKQTIMRLLGEAGLTVDRIAAEMGISTHYLNRLMRADGLSPMSFAWQMRLERAARLLGSCSRGKTSIKEVAYRCGFLSDAHFSRAFKGRYGLSPREFLRRAHLVPSPDGA